MKTSIRIVLMIFGFQLTFVNSSSAQKLIQIDENLKSNSQQLKAKRKGLSSVGKYEFGPYQVISGKGGWEKTTQKSPLFSDNSSIKMSTSKSFVFTNDKADTAFASIAVAENVEIDGGSWIIRTFTPWSDAEVKNGEGIFECAFSFSSGTDPWTLVAIYPVSAEVDGIYQTDDHTVFRGILSDNKTMIEIVEINVNEKGKNSFINPVLGYEFWLDEKCLAAVQVLPANRWYIWMSFGLDPDLEFLLASAVTAMLVRLM
ncbi:MAG: hypothetical protein U9R49_04910 [Bacteroidota bacterium]|nr:hypothetical protein [Bacteroidota bacterium]